MQLLNNSATKTVPNNQDDKFYGGKAIFMSSKNVIINSTTFKNNRGEKKWPFQDHRII